MPLGLGGDIASWGPGGVEDTAGAQQVFVGSMDGGADAWINSWKSGWKMGGGAD